MPITKRRVIPVVLVALVVAALLLPIGSASASENQHSPFAVPNPASDLWRAVRQRDLPASGTTQVQGPESGVLITESGEAFRTFRNETLIGNSGLVIAVTAGIVVLFYLIRGRIPVPGGSSGRRILRFPGFDRALHWFTAVLFVILALTGLTLMFGRYVVIPLLGPEAFGVVANTFKTVHNWLGPLFVVAVAGLAIRFGVRNLPARGDLKWIIKGGGIIGNAHVSAGFFNAGEKLWFLLVMVLGIVVSVSGLMLVFPIFGFGRELMQLALIIHAISSVLFIAGSFGHIYIGTIGTEGSLNSMTTGYVDANWAKAHHDLWHDEMEAAGAIEDGEVAVDKQRSGSGPAIPAQPGKA